MPEVRWTVSLELAGVGGGDQMAEAFKAHRFSRPRRGACWSSGSPHLVAILGLSETAERRRGGESSGQHAFSNTERGWWLLNAERGGAGQSIVRVVEGLDRVRLELLPHAHPDHRTHRRQTLTRFVQSTVTAIGNNPVVRCSQ